MTTHIRWLVVIIVLTVFSAWMVIPRDEDIAPDFNDDGEADFTILGQQPLGLDLVGGLRVLLQTTVDPSTYTDEDLAETANNVSRRVNALGLTEATVQIQGQQRVLVEIPGETDRQQAIDTIQQTALLEFVDFSGLTFTDTQRLEGNTILTTEQIRLGLSDSANNTAERNPLTGQPFETGLTGDCLRAASAQFGQTGSIGNDWFINFEVDSECVGEFSEFTGRMVGQPMALGSRWHCTLCPDC